MSENKWAIADLQSTLDQSSSCFKNVGARKAGDFSDDILEEICVLQRKVAPGADRKFSLVSKEGIQQIT